MPLSLSGATVKNKMKHKNLTAAIRTVSRFVLSGPEFKSRSGVQISVLLEQAVEDKVSLHLVISAYRWRAVPFPGHRKSPPVKMKCTSLPSLFVFLKAAQKVQKIPVSKLILFLFLVAFLVLVVYDRHEAKKTSEIAFPIYPFFSYLYLH